MIDPAQTGADAGGRPGAPAGSRRAAHWADWIGEAQLRRNAKLHQWLKPSALDRHYALSSLKADHASLIQSALRTADQPRRTQFRYLHNWYPKATTGEKQAAQPVHFRLLLLRF
jgi:hypothetical protein